MNNNYYYNYNNGAWMLKSAAHAEMVKTAGYNVQLYKQAAETIQGMPAAPITSLIGRMNPGSAKKILNRREKIRLNELDLLAPTVKVPAYDPVAAAMASLPPMRSKVPRGNTIDAMVTPMPAPMVMAPTAAPAPAAPTSKAIAQAAKASAPAPAAAMAPTFYDTNPYLQQALYSGALGLGGAGFGGLAGAGIGALAGDANAGALYGAGLGGSIGLGMGGYGAYQMGNKSPSLFNFVPQ